MLLATFGLVVFRDLTEGFALALLARNRGARVISGARPKVRRALHQAGVRGHQLRFISGRDALPETLQSQTAT